MNKYQKLLESEINEGLIDKFKKLLGTEPGAPFANWMLLLAPMALPSAALKAAGDTPKELIGMVMDKIKKGKAEKAATQFLSTIESEPGYDVLKKKLAKAEWNKKEQLVRKWLSTVKNPEIKKHWKTFNSLVSKTQDKAQDR